MDDAFIMTTAFFDSFSPPFLNNGDGRDQCKPKLASPRAKCSMCGQFLIEIAFTNHFALVCDNWPCYLFRQPQVCRAKNPEALSEATKYRASTYEDYKAQKRENYRLLRNLGIEPEEANIMSSSNKKTEAALSRGNNE